MIRIQNRALPRYVPVFPYNWHTGSSKSGRLRPAIYRLPLAPRHLKELMTNAQMRHAIFQFFIPPTPAATMDLSMGKRMYILCRSRLIHAMPCISGQTSWVNAMCIDQRNESERTSQVQMMGDVYKQCRQAIVCNF
jgi:hypothetical protein